MRFENVSAFPSMRDLTRWNSDFSDWHLAPLAGLYTGILSILPLIALAIPASGRVASSVLLLFSGLCFLLMEWSNRFQLAESVRQVFRTQDDPAAGTAVCAVFCAVKMLVLYLLFTRTLLFGSSMLLLVILLVTPILSRTAMLWGPGRRGTFIGRLCVTLIALLAVLFVVGNVIGAGPYLSARAWVPGNAAWSSIGAIPQSYLLRYALRITALPLLLCAGVIWRWSIYLKKLHPQEDSVPMTLSVAAMSELAVFAGFLAVLEKIQPV